MSIAAARAFQCIQDVPRVAAADATAERHAQFEADGTPYIISDGVPAAARTWTFSTLLSRIGNISEKCLVSEDGQYLFGNDTRSDPYLAADKRSRPGGRYASRVLALEDLLARIQDPAKFERLVFDNETLYWLGAQLPLALEGDFADVIPIMQPGVNRSFWISQAGCASTLHYDITPGFMLQILGTKDFVLAPGGADLYPYPDADRRMRNSYVYDLTDFDTDRYPNFGDTPCWAVTLQPGDAIFVPALVWHYVQSAENAAGVRLSYVYDALVQARGLVGQLFGDGGPLARLPAGVRNALLSQVFRDTLDIDIDWT